MLIPNFIHIYYIYSKLWTFYFQYFPGSFYMCTSFRLLLTSYVNTLLIIKLISYLMKKGADVFNNSFSHIMCVGRGDVRVCIAESNGPFPRLSCFCCTTVTRNKMRSCHPMKCKLTFCRGSCTTMWWQMWHNCPLCFIKL